MVRGEADFMGRKFGNMDKKQCLHGSWDSWQSSRMSDDKGLNLPAYKFWNEFINADKVHKSQYIPPRLESAL